MKKTRVWIGISASVLLTPSVAAAEAKFGVPANVPSVKKADRPALPGLARQGEVGPSALRLTASEGPKGADQAESKAHQAKSGEGGEGGEVGIDPEEAAADPVKWGVAARALLIFGRSSLHPYWEPVSSDRRTAPFRRRVPRFFCWKWRVLTT